jgi:hypothetical protein
MPATALQYGVDPATLKDPAVSLSLQRRIMTDLLNRYHGDQAKALAAYNTGPGHVDRGIIPAITRKYVADTLGRLPEMGGMLTQAVGNQLRKFPQFNPMYAAPQGTPDLVTQAVGRAHQALGRFAQSPYGTAAMMALPMVLEHGEGAPAEELPGASVAMGEQDPLASFAQAMRRPTTPLAPVRPTAPLNIPPDEIAPYGPMTRPYSWPPSSPEDPFSAAYRGYGLKPPATEPLSRIPFGGRTTRLHPETTPLPAVGASIEPRFHGTPEALAILGDPLQHSALENLYGPGLYTTDDYTVASGYGEGGSGVIYRIYQKKPVKFLNVDDPIPRRVFVNLIGKDPGWGTFVRGPDPADFSSLHDYEQYMRQYPKSPSWEQVKDRLNVYASRTKVAAAKGGAGAGWIPPRGSWANPQERMLDLIAQLKKEGYGGLTHEGGKLSRGVPHTVKIYWDPENQVSMRQVSAQAATSDFGRVPPPLPERVSNVAKRHLKEMEKRRPTQEDPWGRVRYNR